MRSILNLHFKTYVLRSSACQTHRTMKAEAGLPIWLTYANPITSEYHYFYVECQGNIKQQLAVNGFFSPPYAGFELDWVSRKPGVRESITAGYSSGGVAPKGPPFGEALKGIWGGNRPQKKNLEHTESTLKSNGDPHWNHLKHEMKTKRTESCW